MRIVAVPLIQMEVALFHQQPQRPSQLHPPSAFQRKHGSVSDQLPEHYP